MPKKPKAEEVKVDKDNPLSILRAEIEKKYGKKVMVSAAGIMEEEQVVVPVGPSLDLALYGGIPRGTWCSISGPPKVGKTTTLLSFAASCQKTGMRVHYFNVEMRLKKKNLGGITGLDLHPDKFVLYESNDKIILSGQDYLEIVIHVLQTDPACLIIIDSVSALVEKAVLEDGLGTATRGGGAKLVSQFIDIVAAVVPVRKSIVTGVTHIIADTSGRSKSGTSEKAANRWLYQADVRAKATYAAPWEVGGSKNKDGQVVGGKEIGKIIKWTIQESALGPPGVKCESYLRYGVGIDRAYEIMEMAKAAQLFEMSGNWYGFNFLEEKPELLKGQKTPNANGAEQAYALLNANPDWVSFLGEKVKEYMMGEAK